MSPPAPRVPLLTLSPRAEARLTELGGEPINLYRALANQPALLEAWIEFTWALRTRCRTSRGLRELMILRGAQIAGSDYQWQHHSVMATDAGVDGERIRKLDRWREEDIFTASERAALAFTEMVMSGRVDEVVSAELAQHFDAAERVELTLTAGFYAMVPRVLDALGVPLES